MTTASIALMLELQHYAHQQTVDSDACSGTPHADCCCSASAKHVICAAQEHAQDHIPAPTAVPVHRRGLNALVSKPVVCNFNQASEQARCVDLVEAHQFVISNERQHAN